MYAEERKRHIASLIGSTGRVNVTDLAERFNVAAETIRRDLAALDQEGTVQRVHGGAVANEAEPEAAEAAKRAIAQAALDYVPRGGSTVFLDSGTTTGHLAARITARPPSKDSTFVTNSLPVALDLSAAGFPDVQLLGGTVRASTKAVVGGTALRTLALLQADVAFIGTSALTIEHGLSTSDRAEAAIKTAMSTSARKVVAVCDSTKIGREYHVSFAPVTSIDVLVTDSGAPAQFVEELREHGVEVVVAPVSADKQA